MLCSIQLGCFTVDLGYDGFTEGKNLGSIFFLVSFHSFLGEEEHGRGRYFK